MPSVSHKWRRFYRLSGYERGALIEAAAGLVATWAGLRLAGFRRWNALMEWLSPSGAMMNQPATGLESAEIVARMEAAAARNLLFRPTCLERSLVLWWLLRRRGIPAELRIGARQDQQRFAAHAWVQCLNTTFDDSGETHLHFVPFDGPIASPGTPTR
jgi:Transglutaminase-like superfamily